MYRRGETEQEQMGKVFHSEATSLDVRSFLSAKFSTSLLSSDNTPS